MKWNLEMETAGSTTSSAVVVSAKFTYCQLLILDIPEVFLSPFGVFDH